MIALNEINYVSIDARGEHSILKINDEKFTKLKVLITGIEAFSGQFRGENFANLLNDILDYYKYRDSKESKPDAGIDTAQPEEYKIREVEVPKPNYSPVIIWAVIGIICLIWSHSGGKSHLVIRGSNISFGWLAIVYAVVKLIMISGKKK